MKNTLKEPHDTLREAQDPVVVYLKIKKLLEYRDDFVLAQPPDSVVTADALKVDPDEIVVEEEE